ncbi:MAG: phosphomannomutase/phosphoglucomutase [Anaerovoracaceae bacterium]|jgi:phosphomannomutase
MSEFELSKLQNGSDIRGIAIPDEGETAELTERSVTRLVKGFLLWLSERTGKEPADLKVSIGRDSRLSGPDIMRWSVNALAPYGVTVLDCGLATTPAMFMSTIFEGYLCDGALMVTASHMPPDRNGLKFFTRRGGLEKEDIAQIIDYAESREKIDSLGPMTGMTGYDIVDGQVVYPAEESDLMPVYASYLRELIVKGTDEGGNETEPDGGASAPVTVYNDKPLEGLKIVVDAGNGAGGFYATEVLEPLGADVSGSLFLEPDGTFPNHVPNPENADALRAICDQVKATDADLGLIFDTDVDRSAAVGPNGEPIARNAVVALAAAITAKEAPGTTVVTDSVTSDHLTDFIEGLGLKHFRYKRGYRNVINKAAELNAAGVDSALAIETSGHCAMRSNFFMDDGAYLATRIVIEEAMLKAEGRSISDLISGLVEPASAEEHRLPIHDENFRDYGNMILEKLAEWAGARGDMTVVEPNYEGVRVSFDDGNLQGWFLLRLSLHEPLMPLNIESDAAGGCTAIMGKLKPFLAGFPKLEIV